MKVENRSEHTRIKFPLLRRARYVKCCPFKLFRLGQVVTCAMRVTGERRRLSTKTVVCCLVGYVYEAEIRDGDSFLGIHEKLLVAILQNQCRGIVRIGGNAMLVVAQGG